MELINSPLTNGKSVLDDDMFSEFVSDEPTDMENTPVNDSLESLVQRVIDVQSDVTEIKQMLAPLAPFIAALPELMEKVDPLMEGLRTSPVLRMMGVKIP